MSSTQDTWTRAHDLALIYIALAYGTDHELSDAELHSITDTLQNWRPDFAQDDVREVVMEAFSVYLEEGAADEVARAMERLRDALDEEERRRALEGVVRIAEADGVMLTSERGFISTLASIWDVKSTARELLADSTAEVGRKKRWTLLHDIGLMYIVLAHATDDDLSEPEITAIIQRLGDWQPNLADSEVRRLVREVLEVYSKQPGVDILRNSVEAIKERIPMVQRLALLDDLVFIAEVDGAVNEHEKAMIGDLARAWHVGIRMNGALAEARSGS